MSMIVIDFDKKVKELNEQIQKDMDHWKDVHDNGCNDPFWSDGVNLNLIRNHIIYHLHELVDLRREPRQTSLFDVEIEVAENPELDPRVPQIMPDDYMANDREILGGRDKWG